MSKCPNKSHPLYSKLENALGENLTYQAYYQNDYNLPDYTEDSLYDTLTEKLSSEDAIRTLFNMDTAKAKVKTFEEAREFIPINNDTVELLGYNNPLSIQENTYVHSVPEDRRTGKDIEFLKERFPDAPVDFYEGVQHVGSQVAHGYMKNSAFYIWHNAEVGTAYHEAFHGLTQMYFTDAKQQSLYDVAAEEFGMDRSNELAIEERLAENFRDYMLMQEDATIPERIKQFLKSLYFYVKSLVTDSVSMDQAYTMLETGRIPQRLKRNVDRFQPDTALYSLRPNTNAWLQKDLVDGIYSIYESRREINEARDPNQRKSEADVLDEVRKYFLTHAFSGENFNPIRETRAKELAHLKNEDPEKFQEKLDEYGYEDAPTDEAIQNIVYSEEKAAEIQEWYLDIAMNWKTKDSGETGNFVEPGWKDIFIEALPEYGYKYEEYQVEHIGAEDTQERIFDRSSLEESMKDKLSGRVRQFIKSINDTSGFTHLGLKRKVESTKAYTDILQEVHNAEDYTEMVSNLRDTSVYKPYLKWVANRLESADNNLKAQFAVNFKQHYTDFMIMKQYKNAVAIFSANQNNLTTKIVDSWKADIFRDKRTTKDNLYIIELEDDGTRKYSLNEKVAKKIQEPLERLYNFKVTTKAPLTDQVIEDVAEVLKSLSLFQGVDLVPMLKQHLQEGVLIGKVKYRGKDLLTEMMFPSDKNDSSISQLIRSVADFKYDTRKRKMENFELKDSPENFFENRNNVKLLHDLADIQKKGMTDIVQSFLDANKKTVYPYNMPTQLSDVVNKLKRREYFISRDFSADPNYSPTKNTDYQSPLYRMLLNSKSLTDQLEWKKYDALQDKNDSEGTTYREQAEKSAKLARMHGFINDGDGTYSYFPFPTQSDRDFFAMIRLPRVNAWKNFGLADMSTRKVVRNELFSQIQRYQDAKEVINQHPASDWVPNLHYKMVNGKKDKTKGNAFQLTGLLEGIGWKKIDNVNIKDISLEDYENNTFENVTKEQVDELIDTYTQEFNDMINKAADAKYQELLDLQVIKNKDGELRNSNDKPVTKDFAAEHPFGKKINRYKNFTDMLRQHELNSRIMKNEIIKIFYQNRDFFKNYDDFSKRAGLLTTPGLKPVIKGDVAADWGLSENITEIIIDDTYDIHNEDTSLYQYLKSKDFDWAKEYKKGASNKSDAQGYMSIDAYREWQQAFGNDWTDQHEQAYRNYKDGGRFRTEDGFVPSILPIKPSVLGPMEHTVGNSRMIAPVSIKNSYMVLLREFTQEDGSPLRHFDNLRQRMELEGEYADKNLEPVHWANTESTHKILKTNIVNLDKKSDLSDVITHQIPADLVRVPQVKPEKESKNLLLGSQTLRLLTSLINKDISSNYELATGESLTRTEWVNEYHQVISDMVNTSIDNLREEIGYTPEDQVQTRDQELNMLKNVREMLVEQAKESNRPMPDNQRKGLDIKLKPEGYRFDVPLAFPAFSRKNEQMLFSIFRNNLIQQKIQGKQVVQAAELGDVTATGPLNFITLDGEKASKGKIGNIKKAEVAVSADVADMLGLKEGDDLSKLPDSVKSLLGYRIPTSGKSLMLPMVIKRILPSNYKATIVVPGQITTQMGSDFDVDALMLFAPHNDTSGDTLSRLKYDKENPTREMMENRFMELMESVLTHPEHLEEVVQPVEGGTLENRAAKESKNDTVLNPNDPNTDVEYQIRNRDGKAGIGIYSNALMGYVTSQSMGLELSNSLVIKKNANTHVLDDLSPIRDIDGVSVEDNIRQHQIAAIDNAKTPIMKALNDNALTSASTIFLLTSGVDLNSIVDFRTHPAIKKLVREYENREAKPYELKAIAEEVFEGVNDYVDDLDYDLDFDNLEGHSDIHVVSKFIEFTKAGRDFTKLSNILTPNRISDMSSNAALAEYQNQLDFVNNGKFNTFSIPEMEGMTKVEILDELYPMNKAYRSAIHESIKFSQKFFPYHTTPVKQFKNDLLRLIGKDAVNKDVHNKFHDFLFTYMLSIPDDTGGTFFDGEYVQELLTGDENLVKRVMDLKNEDGHFADNLFISALTNSKHNIDNEIQMFDFNTAVDYDKEQVDIYSDALLELYNTDKYRDIAVDLMNYSMFTTGFSPAPNNFMQMIPIEMWKDENLGHMDKFYEQLSIFKDHQDMEDYTDLVNDFILHNVQTKGLLHSIPLEDGQHKDNKLNVDVNQAQEKGLLAEDNSIRRYVRAYNPDTKDFDLWVFRQRNEDGQAITYEYVKSGQKGQDYKLVEPNFQLERVGAFPHSILESNRRRNTSGGTYRPRGYTQKHRKSRVTGNPRKNTLKQTFENAGINVSIKIDNNIDSLGKVDIGSEGVTITMKSENLRGPDTEIHEFGHIYVEALGYKSDIIQQGIEQLRNGELWNEIKRLYPELSQEALEKEVLVTAIGEEGANFLNQPWWKAWWNRMLNKVKELFGIERNVAQQLAQEMLSNDLRPLNTSQFVFDRTFRHRKKKKLHASKERVKEMVVNLEKQIDQIRQLSRDPGKSAQAKLNLQKMLQRRLEESFNIQEEVQSIQDFVEHANTDFATLENQIEQLRHGNKTSDFMSKAGQMIQLVEHYQILDDIKLSAKGVLDSTDNGPTMELLQHTIDLRDRVKDGLNDVVIPVMAEELSAKAHPKIEKAVKEMIEQIDDGYIPNERAIKKTSEYKNIQANTALSDTERQEQINELAKRQLRERIPNSQNVQTMLRRASKGDNYYLWMVDPVIYSDDQAIQLFTLLVKDKLADAREATLEWREKYDNLYNEFVKKTGLNHWNNETNNERILEDVTYSTKRDGEWVTIKRKSFVQPYDVDKFNENRYNLYSNLHKEFKIPQDPDLFQEWKENNLTDYRKYKKKVEKWYRKHTMPVENWQEIRDENWSKLNEMIEESMHLDRRLDEGELTEEQYTQKKESITQEKLRLENWFESNFADGAHKKPINELSRPAKGEGVGRANYTNAKYEWLQRPENSAYKEYHDKLMESYRELQDVYGKYNFQTNKWDEYSYYVPSVRKNDKDRLLENGIKDSATEYRRKLSMLDTDDVYGQNVDTQKRIPIYYANAVDAKNISNDITSSMMLFAKQAMEYTELSDALGHVFVMRNILENRQIPEVDSQGNSMFDIAGSKFGWKQKVESKTPASETRHFKQWESWVDQVFFGVKNEKHELGNFELNKVVNATNKFSAYNVFPLNFLQGAANVFIGNTYILEEAIAGEHFSKSDYVKAQEMYTRAIPGLLNDIGRTIPVSKLGQLIDIFDVQEGMTMANIASNVFNNRLKNMATAEQAMFLQRSGELQMAVTPFLAMMHNMKVQDQNGEEISLYDAYHIGKDGKVTLKDGIELSKEQRNEMTNKVNAINRSLQGVYDMFNANHLKKKWYGKALQLFRSWLLPTYRRFWGYNDADFRLDHEMGSVREGIYRTGMRFFGRALMGADRFSMDAYKKMNEVEKRNVKKMIAHMGMILVTFGMIAALRSGDDDEELNQAQYYGLYWSHRLRSELMIFLNPVTEGQKLLRSPAANTMMITKLNKLFVAMLGDGGRTLTGKELDEYERSIGLKEKGDSMLYWRIRDLIPGFNSLDNSRSPEEAYKWYTELF